MNYLVEILPGLAITLQLWVFIMLLSLLLGSVVGLILNSRVAVLRWPIEVIVFLGRAFPGLVVLYIAYYGLPNIGISLDAFAAVVLAFSFTGMAYVGEMMRGAISSVPQGPVDASLALGVSRFHTNLSITIPQAIRFIVGPLIGFSAIVLQAISLAFSVGLRDMVGEALNLGTLTFDTLPYMISAGAVYIVFCGFLSLAFSLWQTKNVDGYRRRAAGRLHPLVSVKPPQLSAQEKL